METKIRIGVYLKSNPEPIYKEVDVEDLLKGKNINEALSGLGITENNFVRGFFQETLLKVVCKSYDEFRQTAWYIRQKLLRRR